MKVLKKNFFILIILIVVLGSAVPNISNAASSVSSLVGQMSETLPADKTSKQLRKTIGKLLGFLRIAAGLVSVIVISLTGFNYIVAQTPDMKDELKKKMLPIIIGLVLVFGAVSIAQFILGAVGG